MQVFKTSRTVIENDIDYLKHINKIRFLEWIQALAAVNQESVSMAIQRQENARVVIRHEIDYLTAAIEGDQLELKTNVSKCEVDTSIQRIIDYKCKNRTISAQKQNKMVYGRSNDKKPQMNS